MKTNFVTNIRVENERRAHTEDDILLKSRELKSKFPHILNYPSYRAVKAEMNSLSTNIQGLKVLDLGCGRGENSLLFLERGAFVTGIDISAKYIEEAKSMARKSGYSPNQYDFVVMDAHHLEYIDNSFDLVLGTGILHHLDISACLNEVARILKSKGQAIFLEPLGDNPLLKIFRWITPKARTIDEKPLTAKDIHYVRNMGQWKFCASYCGIVSAPLSVITSIFLHSHPENRILRAGKAVDNLLSKYDILQPCNQYILLKMTKV